MSEVESNYYYMRVSESNEKKDGSEYEYEPDFQYKDMIKLGSFLEINNERNLLNAIEDALFKGFGTQLNRSFFKRESNEYGYFYVAKLIFDEGQIIEASEKKYNLTKKLEVEVSYYPELSMSDIRSGFAIN